MTRASPSAWKILPAPALRESLGFEAIFSDDDAKKILEGLVPEQMDDKWFIYHADGWLRFHRSWTGAMIYALHLDRSSGLRVTESWVNRDPEQYKETDTAYDRKLVGFLIDALLLKKKAVFPMPSASTDYAPGLVQHSYVGRHLVEQLDDNEGDEVIR
jgi:hypothetical protein